MSSRLAIGLVLAVSVSASQCACSRRSSSNFVVVDENDPKMTAAIERARASVDQFANALHAPTASQSLFAVKAPVTDGKHIEHMWISRVTFDGQSFQGVINNEPEAVKGYALGQKISVERARISDWMYVDDGHLKGGYTIRVLRDAMTAQQRAESDREMPFKID